MKFFVVLLFVLMSNVYACTGGCITPSIGEAATKAIEASFKAADKTLAIAFKTLETTLTSNQIEEERQIRRSQKIHSLLKFNTLNLKKISHEMENFLKIININKNLKELKNGN